MPPILHPRSSATTALFVTTLAASFVVVGIPHVFPCPRPRKGYQDGERELDADGKPIRKKRRSGQNGRQVTAVSKAEEEMENFRRLEKEAEVVTKEAHECPVPKPTGLLGRIMGFDGEKKAQVEISASGTK